MVLPYAGGTNTPPRDFWRADGIDIGRQRVRMLVRRMGIEALYRRPNTSKPAQGHRVFPYLWRNVKVERPNQAWAMDLTFITMAKGFVYLAAVGLGARKMPGDGTTPPGSE